MWDYQLVRLIRGNRAEIFLEEISFLVKTNKIVIPKNNHIKSDKTDAILTFSGS